jgi:hypothetical protein
MSHFLISPLTSIVAIEVDYDAGAMSVLLAAPPSAYLGQLTEVPMVRVWHYRYYV